MNCLVIGDLHINSKRGKAIALAFDGIRTALKDGDTFDTIVITGDVWDKYPNMDERLTFAKFLTFLCKHTDKVVIIKGTDTHDYSQGIYNLDDLITILPERVSAEEELKLGKYLFVHAPIIGAKYDNGIEEKEGLDLSTIPGKVIAGHYHTPSQDKQLICVGSIYKTNFSQKDNQKRIVILKGNKIDYLPIQSRPMYEITIIGSCGKMECKELAELKKLPYNYELDLKIKVTTDSQTLPSIHLAIAKIKHKFNIEYYQEDIDINRVQVELPKDLNETNLLKTYCGKHSIEYGIIEGELNNDKAN